MAKNPLLCTFEFSPCQFYLSDRYSFAVQGPKQTMSMQQTLLCGSELLHNVDLQKLKLQMEHLEKLNMRFLLVILNDIRVGMPAPEFIIWTLASAGESGTTIASLHVTLIVVRSNLSYKNPCPSCTY